MIIYDKVFDGKWNSSMISISGGILKNKNCKKKKLSPDYKMRPGM